MSINTIDGERTCPRCASPEYGPLDLGWPFGDPQHNPNPHARDIVWVCLNCEFVLEPNGDLT